MTLKPKMVIRILDCWCLEGLLQFQSLVNLSVASWRGIVSNAFDFRFLLGIHLWQIFDDATFSSWFLPWY